MRFFRNNIHLWFFILSFLIVYLPHFIYINYPQVGSFDSFAYLLVAKDFFYGEIPLQNYHFDLPYGYPFFIFINYLLGGNLLSVIISQTILQFLSVVFLIDTIKKVFSLKIAVVFSVFTAVFFTLSQNLLYNTIILTESLFISFLILITSFLLLYLSFGKRKYLFLMMFSILMITFIRSNGLYLLFIPFLLFIRSFFISKKHTKELVFSVFLLFILSATSNFFIKDIFLPFEPDRIAQKLGLKEKNILSKEKLQSEVIREKYCNVTLKEQAFKLLTNVNNDDFANHYYYRMPIQVKKFGEETTRDEIVEVGYVREYKNSTEKEEDVFSFVIHNFNFGNKAEVIAKIDINKKPRHPWLYLNHLIHLSKFLIRNWLFVIGFYFSLIITLFKLFSKDKFINTTYEFVLYILCIHLFNLFVLIPIVPCDTSLSRYSFVTEIMVYLAISILIFEIPLIKKKFNVK